MSDLRKAAEQVLAWMEDPHMNDWHYTESEQMYMDMSEHITALRAALDAPQPAPQQAEPVQDLYWRLHNLSKVLEGSGRIDQHDHPDAYKTILDAMVMAQQAEPQWIACSERLPEEGQLVVVAWAGFGIRTWATAVMRGGRFFVHMTRLDWSIQPTHWIAARLMPMPEAPGKEGV